MHLFNGPFAFRATEASRWGKIALLNPHVATNLEPGNQEREYPSGQRHQSRSCVSSTAPKEKPQENDLCLRDAKRAALTFSGVGGSGNAGGGLILKESVAGLTGMEEGERVRRFAGADTTGNGEMAADRCHALVDHGDRLRVLPQPSKLRAQLGLSRIVDRNSDESSFCMGSGDVKASAIAARGRKTTERIWSRLNEAAMNSGLDVTPRRQKASPTFCLEEGTAVVVVVKASPSAESFTWPFDGFGTLGEPPWLLFSFLFFLFPSTTTSDLSALPRHRMVTIFFASNRGPGGNGLQTVVSKLESVARRKPQGGKTNGQRSSNGGISLACELYLMTCQQANSRKSRSTPSLSLLHGHLVCPFRDGGYAWAFSSSWDGANFADGDTLKRLTRNGDAVHRPGIEWMRSASGESRSRRRAVAETPLAASVAVEPPTAVEMPQREA
ncbi:hypothetical protein B0H16DRAFT_1462260 [Mycena metata]|uniref:Uncharacterized protein n=1 Tax=Mycena metata TaxID=1033252 RepID=A0AAD7N569_9AGAR|nr:hypothetical protein B0H16DRAFT_1462260 [Mycena metata]